MDKNIKVSISNTLRYDLAYKALSYKIENVDFWEKDAILVIGDDRFYFQWHTDEHPTILDAIRYLSNDNESKWGLIK